MQVGSWVLDYVHLSDAKLEEIVTEKQKGSCFHSSLNEQVLQDVQNVIKARKEGKAWAWRHSAYAETSDNSGLFLMQKLHMHGWRVMVSPEKYDEYNKVATVGAISSDKDLVEALTSTVPSRVNFDTLMPEYMSLIYVPTQGKDTISARQIMLLEAAIKGKRLVVCHSGDFHRIYHLIDGGYVKGAKTLCGNDQKKLRDMVESHERILTEYLTTAAQCELLRLNKK